MCLTVVMIICSGFGSPITEAMFRMHLLRFSRKSGFMELKTSGLWGSWIRSSLQVSLLILGVVEPFGDFAQSIRELYWPIESSSYKCFKLGISNCVTSTLVWLIHHF